MKIRGIVQKGQKKGKELGYPTANIPLQDASISGIYAARVSWEKENRIAVVFADERRDILEAHILDFSGDLYGKDLSVELLKKIREREDFTDMEALRKRIESDIQSVREYFN